MEPEFDLLGDPIPPGWTKRGRPPHVPTDEKRKLVIQLQAFGWTMEKIAMALSITPPTLRKNYFRELKKRFESKAIVEAAVLNALMKQVEAGNVSAIDKYLKRLDKKDREDLAERVANRSIATRSPKVGKKEQRLEAAKAVDGKFAPPPPPELLN